MPLEEVFAIGATTKDIGAVIASATHKAHLHRNCLCSIISISTGHIAASGCKTYALETLNLDPPLIPLEGEISAVLARKTPPGKGANHVR